MLKNYIKIAFRNLWKHKLDSSISIGGLAVGIACCILLLLFVRMEWSYDDFHEDSDQIHRLVMTTTGTDGDVSKRANISYPVGPELQTYAPEIKSVVRMGMSDQEMLVDNKYVSQDVLFAEPGFFSFFTFPLISGNAESVLSEANNVVITQEMAEQLFETDQVIDEAITFRFSRDNSVVEKTYRVSGVAEDLPANSSTKFDIILPMQNYWLNYDNDTSTHFQENFGGTIGIETWMKLAPGTSGEQIQERVPLFVETHYASALESPSIENISLSLQPLNSVYFDQSVETVFTEQGNSLYSLVLTGIAFVVLAIASINFMSLTLSRASGRSSEIGIRKVVGAYRRQLGQQFLGEVFITCGLAFILGIILAELLVPYFQMIVQKPIELGLFQEPQLWLLLAGLLLFTTLLTGGYPAFFISGKKGSGLFSSQRTTEKIPGFVKGLIVVQFTLSISFLVMTLVMNKQLNLLIRGDLGFTTDNIVLVEVYESQDYLGNTVESLYLPEIRSLAGIESVATTASNYANLNAGFYRTGRLVENEEYEGIMAIEIVDEHYLETMEIELTQGTNFSPDNSADISEGIIINESFAEVMGWEEPVGEFTDWIYPEKRVIGVVEDYHFRSLYTEMQPMVIQHLEAYPEASPFRTVNTLIVKVEDGQTGQVLDQLATAWDDLFPNEVFRYSFLDDRARQFYEDEQRWGSVMQASSGVAILLACFGLFGLASLTAGRRSKEISIRKVLGATVANIITLLNRDFLKLVVLGFILSVPIAWYFMNRWLETFAYRIEISAGIIIMAGALAILIAIVTVSWQSIRAALANPVDSLRSE